MRLLVSEGDFDLCLDLLFLDPPPPALALLDLQSSSYQVFFSTLSSESDESTTRNRLAPLVC